MEVLRVVNEFSNWKEIDEDQRWARILAWMSRLLRNEFSERVEAQARPQDWLHSTKSLAYFSIAVSRSGIAMVELSIRRLTLCVSAARKRT